MEDGVTTERHTTAGEPRTGLPRRVARWLSAHRPLIGAGVAILLGGLAAAAGCERTRHGAVAANDRAAMARAAQVVDSLERQAWIDETPHDGRPLLDDGGLVALGYLERAALGAGSPFRLAEFALRDPRLPASLGRTTAWAVLARTAQDSAAVYATDAAAFRAASGIGPVAVTRHRALIDSVVFAAPDARTGEAAVRIGYGLAVAAGTVSGAAATVATRVAAQVRDRRLAREDALRLLHAAATDRNDVPDALALLVRWRSERRFQVEQPLLSEAMRADDATAVRAGIALRDAIRRATDLVELQAAADSAAARSAADTIVVAADTASGATPPPPAVRTLLPPRAARRLADLPSVRGAPPQAPVAVAAAAYRRQLQRDATSAGSPKGGADLAGVRRRFADRVRSEETLAAELAVAAQAPGGVPADVAGVALVAAVAMRPFAQDTLLPLAGAGAPMPEALVARYGLREVTFDASVPAAWRPYHLAQLGAALEDLRTVLPWVEFDGLAVRVGESAKRDSALALHDPASRTLYLPAATGAGTIAHELAHDLDWQTARTQLAVRGTYSTDRVTRGSGSGALAVSVRGLTAARPRNGASTGSERPAELFARGVDWYVATALAATGRSNGALSAVQDEALAGYAGVVPPEAGDGVADALVRLLGDMTVVPQTARDRFLGRWGEEGAPTALTLVRSTWSMMPSWGAERALRSFGLLAPVGCVAERPEPATEDTWRTALLRAAAESRARGMLRGRGRRWAVPAKWSWEARATLGPLAGPWNPAVGDSAVARTRDALLRAMVWDDAARRPLVDGGIGALGADALRSCR
jgi:hypothetical protein